MPKTGTEAAHPDGAIVDSATIKDFETRIADYVKLHQKAKNESPPARSTNSPAKLSEYHDQLAPKIRGERATAKAGDIFTPETTALFKRLIAKSFAGPKGTKVKTSLHNAEPVQDFHLQVNAEYPDEVPLQSTPSTLLRALPQLPRELEYRIVGRDLVLRDRAANLIVDFIPGAFPAL